MGSHEMKLKLRRSQQSGITGTVKFTLNVIVDLDADEQLALKKYKFGKSIVYESPKGAAATEMFRATGGSFKSSIATIAAKAMSQLLSVNDLVNGKEITCKDISEMIAAEEQVIVGCNGLARILYVCQHFEGEEIIYITPFDPDA